MKSIQPGASKYYMFTEENEEFEVEKSPIRKGRQGNKDTMAIGYKCQKIFNIL